MFPRRSMLIVVVACSIFVSCSRQEVHLHDRHVLSYPSVEAYAKKYQDTTLVLFDYHHDVGPLGPTLLSSNWVGRLIVEGTVSRVLWVSGRDLLLPNKNARIAWLRRKLKAFSPSEAKRIENATTLADWDSLEKQRIAGPLVVSIDFDLFCHDPGSSPERFVDEIAGWTAKQRPGLVTIALSSIYQDKAEPAWKYLGRFVKSYGDEARNSVWFLEAGDSDPATEGIEERDAWRHWELDRETFGRRNESFLPGASIWIAPPLALRETLLGLRVRAGDTNAKDSIASWRDADLARLESEFPQASTDSALAAAAASLEAFWNGKAVPIPDGGQGNIGIALRIQADGGDRGCFALYRGLADPVTAVAYLVQLAADDPRYKEVLASEKPNIDLEISVFGTWHEMEEPYDFRPGLDSLLLMDGTRTTLLQAPIAAERGYGREEFLSRLSNKAGLGLEGWTQPGLRFARATTIWSRRSLASIETTLVYQKYEKK